MTKEDLKYLKSYEDNFRTAMNSSYTRNVVGSALDKMLEIYRKETGINYSLCKHCSSSVVSFLKVMGKVYFNAVQEEKEPDVITNELEKVVTQMENKKVKKTKK